MKKWLAIVMLMSVCYQYMIKLGVMAWYELNKDYVAAELCENKDKPQMHCNGKCYLKKQLKKVDSPTNESKQVPGKNHKVELAEFIPTEIASIQSYQYEVITAFGDYYKNPVGYQPLTAIFHPPPVS